MRARHLSAAIRRCALVAWISAFVLGITVARATELTVGLYPYVPRLDQFKSAIQSEWQKVQPTVTLRFLTFEEWDGGYAMTSPAAADVYVLDALFFEHYRQQSWMEPLAANEVMNLADFLPYAIDGVRVGQQYYAIPQLGCANLLIFDKRDTAIASANTLSQLKHAEPVHVHKSDSARSTRTDDRDE